MALNFNMMGLGFHFFVQDDATLGLRRIDQAFKNVSADAEEMYYKTKASLDQMERQMGALGDARVQSALQKVGMTMTGLGAATLFGLGKAIKSYSEFEQEMLNAQAVAGWTQETFQDLSNFAIQVGAGTRFTSTQVAEALYEFSSAGVTAADSIKELTLAAAGFAAAGNLRNLGDAARSIISAVAGFQLPMTETAHVADVFTKAVQQSMIYAEDFDLAIGRFAGTAGTAGQSLESALTAFMAARRIIGSAEDAATSVARAFQVLSAPPSAEAFRLMGENFLNLDLWDKTTGRMKQWPEIIRELEATFKGIDPLVRQFASFAGQSDAQLKALAETYGLTAEQVRGLTEAARNGTKAFEAYIISELFGSDAIRAVQASLNAEVDAMINGRTVTLRGADALEYWQRTLEDSAGAAQAAAKIQMSGLTGAFLQLEGAIDSAHKALGRQFKEPLLKLATGLTSLVDIFNEMPASMQKTIAYGLALGGIGAILGGMGFLFLAQLPGFLVGLKALREAHIGLKIVTLALRGATLAYHGAILLARGATMVWAGAQWGLNAALTAAQWSSRTAGLLAYRGAMLLVQGATLAWAGVQWGLNIALGGLQLAGRVVALGVYYGAILLVRGATLAWAGVQWVLNAALMANPIGLVIGAAIGLVAAFTWVATHAEKVRAALTGVWNWIADVFNLSDQARQWGINLITGFVEGIESAYEKLKQGLTTAAGWIKKFLGFGSPTELGPGKYADQWAPNMVKMFAGGLRAGLPEVTAAATDMAEAVSRAIVIRPIFQEAGLAGRLTASAEVPSVPSLQGAVNYRGVLGGLPAVPGLEGQVLYQPSLASAPPVPSQEGVVVYHAALGPLPEAPDLAGQLTYQPVAGRPEMWVERPPTVTRPEPMPVHLPLPQSPPVLAPVARQERVAVTGTMSRVAETIRQPIQLVLDGRVLAEIIANIQAENEARAGAY